MKCVICGKEISGSDIERIKDEYDFLFRKADFYGYDCLTETEQVVVGYRVHCQCVSEIDLP